MMFLAAAAYLLSLSQAPAAQVEVAKGDWSDVPVMKSRQFQTIHPDAVEAVHRALAKAECVIPGQSKNRVALRVPFLLEFSEAGKVQRLVLHKLGCAAVERILASVLLKQAESGEFTAHGQTMFGWYRSELRITSS